MQLDKIVAYHKALADPTRLRILLLLSGGELHGQGLAEKLGLSQPTVTHHASKLREAGLLKERRDKNTVYFKLNSEYIRVGGEESLRFIFSGEGHEEVRLDGKQQIFDAVIRNFFSKDGRLRHLPAQYKKKLIVLEHLVRQLEPGRVYSEKEINDFILKFHDDYATIRREFIMHHFMFREAEQYELNPPEMWRKWEEI